MSRMVHIWAIFVVLCLLAVGSYASTAVAPSPSGSNVIDDSALSSNELVDTSPAQGGKGNAAQKLLKKPRLPIQQLTTLSFQPQDKELLDLLVDTIDNHYNHKYKMKVLSPLSPIHHHMSGGSNGVLIVKYQKKDVLNPQSLMSFIQIHIDGCTFINPTYTGVVNCNIAVMTDSNEAIPSQHLNNFLQTIQSYISYHERIHLNLKHIEYNSLSPVSDVIESISPQVMSLFDTNVHRTIHPHLYFGTYSPAPGSKNKESSEGKIQKDVTSGDFKISSKLADTGVIHSKLTGDRQMYKDNVIDKFIFTSTLENNAAIRASMMVEQFTNQMSKVLSKDYSLKKSWQSIQLPSNSDLLTLVRDCNEPLQAISDDNESKLYLTSKAFYLGSIQLRLHMHGLLLPYYQKSIEVLKLSAIADFESKLRKIPGRSKGFPGLTKKLAAKCVKEFETQLGGIRKGYIAALESKGSGLLSINHKSKLFNGIPKEVQLSFSMIESDYNHIDYEVNDLRDKLKEIRTERVRSLFLSGSYNPYIRNLPFPPTHINLNYLFDPRAIPVNREYNKLYDEHVDGVVSNRADPLHIPGVSRMPFNPDDNPVPRDVKPWWKVLIDFYRNEL